MIPIEEHACEICGDILPSYRAALACEDADVAEARDARRGKG